MLLYAICPNPLLSTLDKHLTGLGIGRGRASADDVTILLTSPSDIQKIQGAIHCYEEVTGAEVHIGKWRGVAIGSWDTSLRTMDILYHNEAKMLGIHITSTVQASGLRSWALTAARIRAQAREAYCRDLSLDKRIQYVHDHLTA